MDFIRRAVLFTKARLSRSLLLLVAFTAILVFVLSGLIINAAANRAIDNAKQAAGATVQLSANMQEVVKNAQAQGSSSSSTSNATGGRRFNLTLPTISETTAQHIAALPGVKSDSFSYTASADAASGISKVSQTSSGQGQSGFGGGMPGGSQEDFTIDGTNNLSASQAFTGSYKISSGRAITAADAGSDHVVIESTLASQNKLAVGDDFTLKDQAGKSYTMQIVGIYTPTSTTSENSVSFMNTLYTALSVANAMKGTTNQISGASYAMTNPAKASSFVAAATKLVNDKNFQVAKDDQAYQSVKTSLDNVASFARNIVWLVAVAGAIILALIAMLMVRERRFEIGVLMSLGEARLKIVAQFFTELFMVMIVSVALAVAAGGVVGNAVGQQLLKQESTAQTSAPGNARGAGFAGGRQGAAGQVTGGHAGYATGRPGGGFARAFGVGQSVAERTALRRLNVQTTPVQVLILLGIAVLITLVAVGLASTGILRLSPKQVLTH